MPLPVANKAKAGGTRGTQQLLKVKKPKQNPYKASCPAAIALTKCNLDFSRFASTPPIKDQLQIHKVSPQVGQTHNNGLRSNTALRI